MKIILINKCAGVSVHGQRMHWSSENTYIQSRWFEKNRGRERSYVGEKPTLETNFGHSGSRCGRHKVPELVSIRKHKQFREFFKVLSLSPISRKYLSYILFVRISTQSIPLFIHIIQFTQTLNGRHLLSYWGLEKLFSWPSSPTELRNLKISWLSRLCGSVETVRLCLLFTGAASNAIRSMLISL